jgi:general transcription factor 3C polypeptide 3 (transcription factor C subunit 4)
MAKCYVALHEYQAAEECYLMITRENPTDFSSRLHLAELYETTNRPKLALDVIDAVVRDRDHYRPVIDTPDLTTPATGALIPNAQLAAAPHPRVHKSTQERAVQEHRLREETLQSWLKLNDLRAGMEAGRMEEVETWLVHARELFDEFRGVKMFFSSEKNRRITWFDEPPSHDAGEGVGRGKRRRWGIGDIESRVEEIQVRLQGGERRRSESVPAAETPEPEGRQDLSKERFRGLEFDQWFYMFMQVSLPLDLRLIKYALLLTQYSSMEEAEHVLKTVFEVNVFFQSPRYMKILHTVHTGIPPFRSTDFSVRNVRRQHDCHRRTITMVDEYLSILL